VRVTVATYNVHGCLGTDGRRDVARIARVLRALEAEIIALQEVVFFPDGCTEPHDILAELSGFRAYAMPTRRRDGVHFGNALLTSLPIVMGRSLSLDYGTLEPRTALDVTVDVHGRRLRVIATHLGLRPVERRYQMRRLLEHVVHDDEEVTVLLGDFNEWLIPARILRRVHARFGHVPSLPTFPSRWPLFSLDRIWVHPREAASGFRVHAEGEARVASDHLPVVADVTLSLRREQPGDDATSSSSL